MICKELEAFGVSPCIFLIFSCTVAAYSMATKISQILNQWCLVLSCDLYLWYHSHFKVAKPLQLFPKVRRNMSLLNAFLKLILFPLGAILHFGPWRHLFRSPWVVTPVERGTHQRLAEARDAPRQPTRQRTVHNQNSSCPESQRSQEWGSWYLNRNSLFAEKRRERSPCL